ncbi:MAG: multidrug transporter AcrB [Bacteroidetes bacterium]|nr:MAG: multidrug transporter AcrB [Bacteroidota bacterium]
MKIYESAVRKPISTLLIFVGVILFGLYSYQKLSRDLYPEIEFPYITVFTYYQGANAADIENNITKTLENTLNTTPNLMELTSRSQDNYSMIFMEFDWGTNLDEASNTIRDAIGRVQKRLPEGVDQPLIFKFNSNMIPILEYSITADENFDALPEIVEDILVNPLNRINGIGSIGVSGGAKRAIQVDIDPHRLEAYNLTVEQIGGAIAKENRNIPAGMVEMGTSAVPLRVEAEFKTSEELDSVVVGNFRGRKVFLCDVARVNDSLASQQLVVKRGGERAVKMSIQKQSGANTVTIVEDIQREVERLKKGLPKDVQLEPLFNSAEFIVNSLSSLAETVLYAGIFVMLVILFFLGRWRATLIIIITIPVSLIMAFSYLYLSGNTINIISLSSLSIAIGMVVDDAIVVLENITSQLEKGSSPREAAIYGTNEVGLAVVATTLTVLAVFLPLTMLGGMSGIMFKQLGYIVSIVIVVSTISALTLTPMLASQLLRTIPRGQKRRMNVLQRQINRFLGWLDEVYAGSLAWAVHHRYITLGIATLIFVGSIFLFPMVKTEFMPQSDNSRIQVKLALPAGSASSYTGEMAQEVEDMIRENNPEVQLIVSSYGSAGSNDLLAAFRAMKSNMVDMDIRLVKPGERSRTMVEISDAIRQKLEQFTEFDKFQVIPGGSQGGSQGAAKIEVHLIGHDLEETAHYAELLADRMRAIEGTRDVEVKNDPAQMEYNVRFDRTKLAEAGINSTTAAMYVRNRMNGMLASKYREAGNEYDIIVRYDEKYRSNLEAINDITLYSSKGKPIKLSEVAEVGEFYATPTIRRINRKRVMYVNCGLYKASLNTVVDNIWAAVDELDLPSSITVGLGGTAKDQAETNADMKMLLLLVLALVYIVMASQFESFKEPFMIMLSLPFAFTGVILALLLTGAKLNMTSMIGGIMLVGIVVKNGIVLVDYTNLLRARGYSTFRAVVEGGKSRLRPVLMTALTTILGMLPLALSTGEGSETWKPMGIAVIGGLTFSTFLTLIVVPAVYAMFASRGMLRSKSKNQRSIRAAAKAVEN